MRHLIIADVFGRTNALEKIASDISGSVEIFDPYNSKHMNFKNEAEAYKYFISKVGIDKYAQNLGDVVQSFSKQLCLIGFSIGASAIWKISSQKKLEHISKAICFYGSQIRHNININPTFTVELIFPATENHFSISELIVNLSNRENIHITQTSFYHGFMNSHSENFNQTGYNQFIQIL